MMEFLAANFNLPTIIVAACLAVWAGPHGTPTSMAAAVGAAAAAKAAAMAAAAVAAAVTEH